MAMKKGLGKGLDALLGDFTTEPADGVREVDIYRLDTNSEQPRKMFDENKLRELSESLKQHGMVQPIIVRKNGERFTIVAGERRYRAARIAGFETVPVIVKEIDDAQVMEVALIENIQREDLNPIEEAAAIKFLMQQHDLTQEEVASRLAKSRSAIANTIRLLSLDDDVQNLLREGKLQAGHARALVVLKDTDMQRRLAREIVEKGLSARDAEALAKSAGEENRPAAGEKKKNEKPRQANEISDAEERLREKLGTKVAIVGNTTRGKVVIEYYTKDDLEGIFELLMRD